MILQQLYLMLQNAIKNEEGQGLVEYSLIILFVAIVVVVSVTAIGTQLSAMYVEIAAAFP